MKYNIVRFVAASALTAALVIGFAIVRPVLAQVAATSTDAAATSTSQVDTIASSTPTDASSTPVIESASASTAPAQTTPGNTATTTTNNAEAGASNTSAKKAPTEPPPAGLTEVHIIGTKYTDYFTDGSTTIAVSGDPKADGNLGKPDAPMPTHAGMTWVHTKGQNLYDTPSGDLEVGDYALQPLGTYIENRLPFVSSTSTPGQLPTSTDITSAGTSPSSTASGASPSIPETSTSTAAQSESSSATKTSSEPTTSPAI
jgi:hypothetical protein